MSDTATGQGLDHAGSQHNAQGNYQAGFERRWGQLTRPHVRALAWLLDAPDLLDPAAPQWQGRIATLGAIAPATADWLHALERDPAPLDAALGQRFYSRLGLYAEKLMAFYFQQQGNLVAHGLQVRASRNDTVGEFDFLLQEGGGAQAGAQAGAQLDAQLDAPAGERLLHWEFATKFYLLDAPAGGQDPAAEGFSGLIGPNLADTLGAKMRKIFDKQLSLSLHPAAQALLPQPVDRAQALVKGWLFYPDDEVRAMQGISQPHCSGFWIALHQAPALDGECFIVMPRLDWLAPFKTPADSVGLSKAELLAVLSEQMAAVAAPVMVAAVREENGWLVEQRRGFVVPDDWREQAAQRRQAGALPA